MRIIGVTGLSGSGKTTYCNERARTGDFSLIEIDKFVYATMENPEFIEKAIELLGTDSFVKSVGETTGLSHVNQEANLKVTDRKELGAIVFAKPPEVIMRYNLLIWSYVEPMVDSALEQAKKQGRDVIIEYLFLTITKFFGMCTEKVLVVRDESQRKRSAARRDGATIAYIEARDSAFPFTFNESDFDTIIRVDAPKTALFPGSFDPFHSGHMAVISQATEHFDNLIIGIGVNPDKTRTTSRDEMVEIIKTSLLAEGLLNASVITYDGLTGDTAKNLGATALVRGKRKGEDEAYENDLDTRNKDRFGLETVFYTTDDNTSSTEIRKSN